MSEAKKPKLVFLMNPPFIKSKEESERVADETVDFIAGEQIYTISVADSAEKLYKMLKEDSEGKQKLRLLVLLKLIDEMTSILPYLAPKWEIILALAELHGWGVLAHYLKLLHIYSKKHKEEREKNRPEVF